MSADINSKLNKLRKSRRIYIMRGGGNMQQMMKQMQKMQKKMAEEQEKLKDEKVEGSAGGGMVKLS